MRPATIALLLVLLAAASASGGEPDPLEPVRRDFVRLLDREPGARIGPSATRVLQDLLAHGDEVVSAVCEEAWRLTQTEGARANRLGTANRVRDLVHFLYGIGDPRESGYRHAAGIVLERRRVGPGYFGIPNPPAPRFPPFAEEVKGHHLRAPAPDARSLLRLLEGGLPAGWTDSDRASFAMALGETAASDEAVAVRLLAKYLEAPEDPLLATAIGWLATPRAVDALLERVVALGLDPETRREEIFWRTVDALQHAAPVALVRRLLSRDEGVRRALLDHVEVGVLAPVLLDEIDAATSPERRRRLIEDLLATLRHDCWSGPRPAAGALRPLLEFLHDLVDSRDPDLAAKAGRAAGNLLYWGWGGQTVGNTGGAIGTSAWSKENVGAYPDPVTVLRRTLKDLRSGRLVLLERRPGLFDPPGPALITDRGTPWRARSAFGAATRAGRERDAPVELSAEIVDEGLRLRLRNTGETQYLINPVLLSSGCASFRVGSTRKGGETRPFRVMEMLLSFVNLPLGVPARELRRVDPGEEYEWVLPLRPEDREGGAILVELYGGNTEILGTTDLPLLAGIRGTRIR